MAILSSKAIVISTIKYSDTSLIVRLYTKEVGLVSFLLKGVLKSKKGKLRTAYFQPLNQLSIIFSYQEKRNLQLLKEAQVIHVYETIYTSITKQSIVLFLSEVLSSAIQEEETNTLLYEYLEHSLIWLDSHEQISNFHLLFLLNLTKFLGFYPDVSQSNKNGFHLSEGFFTDNLQIKEVIKGNEINQFKKLLGINFDKLNDIKMSQKSRRELISHLMVYYQHHLDGFKTPKSIHILNEVFS